MTLSLNLTIRGYGWFLFGVERPTVPEKDCESPDLCVFFGPFVH